jgi:hypothetical protein
VRLVLDRIWFGSDQLCGKRLQAALPEWLPHYEKEYGALALPLKEKLANISAATIDRLLSPVRYAKGIYFGRGSVKRSATFRKRQRRARQSDDSGLFRSPCERFVEPCFATICCVSMDDSALGSFIDS